MTENTPLKILAVVCHPADAIDGVGGTLCLHAQRGDAVTVVVCTHGVETHDLRRNDAARFAGRSVAEPEDQKRAISDKERELVEGLEILDICDVRFLRFADNLFVVTTELIEALALILAEVQPDLLILHNPTEELGLADVGHSVSAIAALKARPLANSPSFVQQHGYQYSGRTYPAQTFFMTMNGQTTQLTTEGARHGNVLIDIASVVERKVRAMDCLRSQYYPGDLARKCVEVVNGRMGLHWRLSYAEAFQTHYPHVYSHLPLNDHLRHLAATSREEHCRNLRIVTSEIPFDNGKPDTTEEQESL